MSRAAEEVRRTLTDPMRVCRMLGLLEGAKRQTAGLHVRCPWHADRDPSCSVTRGPDGTLRGKCFSCGAAGDVFALVAARYGLSTRTAFPEVLLLTAELGGLHQLAQELRGDTFPETRDLPPMPEPEPSRDYPPAAEVDALWQGATAVDDHEPAQVALAMRGLFPGPELARCLSGSQGPSWARYRGRPWAETGHRILLPAFDPLGVMRSVRAWQVDRNDPGPKRLPPGGHRATELVLASPAAVDALSAPGAPVSLVVAEGEPDYLSLCQAYPGRAIVGVMSGSWTAAFAARVPVGSEVTIRTHDDEAGNRYAEQIIATLKTRAVLRRRPSEAR